MQWDAIGALGELIGALAVVVTLGYLARQIRHAKSATTDSNRIARATGVRDWVLSVAGNDELRRSFDKVAGSDAAHAETARAFDVSEDDAGRSHYAIVYFFWLHWGQFASSTDEADMAELTHLIDTWYRLPGIRYQWENSPYARPIMDPRFVEFVDGVLARPPSG